MSALLALKAHLDLESLLEMAAFLRNAAFNPSLFTRRATKGSIRNAEKEPSPSFLSVEWARLYFKTFHPSEGCTGSASFLLTSLKFLL